MPEINDQTPRSAITIAKHEFEVPSPYAAGHVLNENEAAALNQTFKENLRNNFAPKVKAKATNEDESVRELTEQEVAELQNELDTIAASYEFGVRGSRGESASLSPIEKHTRKVAHEALMGMLKAKNIKLKDVSEEKYEELISKISEKEEIKNAAQMRLDQEETLAKLDLAV